MKRIEKMVNRSRPIRFVFDSIIIKHGHLPFLVAITHLSAIDQDHVLYLYGKESITPHICSLHVTHMTTRMTSLTSAVTEGMKTLDRERILTLMFRR
jgi:hypothetical protein